MGKTIGDLHALQIEYEKGSPKKAATPQVLAIQGGRIQKPNKKPQAAKGKGKGKGKGKNKLVYVLKPKNIKPAAKQEPKKDDACHHCKEVGHWKRNCLIYLVKLMKKKKQAGTASTSSLRGERKLKQGVVYLYVGNGVRAQVEAIGTCGIVQQHTYPYTPQHNGVFERRNRTLLDMVRSMMNLTTLLLSFWDYDLESTARILNMVPTKKVDKTPYELWYGKVPNFSYLKVRGCEALVKHDTPDKLQQISVKCIFVGYPKETMGYNFYFPPENKIVVARSIRTHRALKCLCLNVEVEEHSLGDLNEPTNYKAALLDIESHKWLDAMNAEMQSMKDNQVWHLVDLPPNDIRAIRILIGIAAFYDYVIWKMDVKTVFLNGYLD
ncbi:retrotransposon protein, putative, ty1-copia subclass [Tanacetum coccineum]